MSKGVALIIGAGDAIGSAIARKFAASGLTVCAARRNPEKLEPLMEELRVKSHPAHAYQLDARKEEQVIDLYRRIEEEVGELDVVVFNIGANVPMGILETDSRKFFKRIP